MATCCFCFRYSNKNSVSDDISLKKNHSEHYKNLIPEPDKKTSNNTHESKPSIEEVTENMTDTSSTPIQADPKQSSFQLQNLYFPSKDSILPCSDLVSSQFSNFEKLLELEASDDWEVKIDKPFACIMVRTGTPSHSDIPLLKAFFDMELNAEPEDLLDVIYNPEIRKKWDASIGAYNEILRLAPDVIHYYMLNKAPWPFKDRDFVEIRYIRKRINGDLEIFFTGYTHSDYPEFKDKAVRGETIIGGQIIRKRVSPITGNLTLMFTTICQADMRGEVPKKALKVTLPSSVLKWYRSVKKQLQIRVEAES